MTDELLTALLAEVRLLRLDLAEQRTAADVRLGLLLRAVRAAVAEQPFTAALLVELASARLSSRFALQAAIGGITGKTRHPAKSLGKFLSAQAGSAADGLRLVRVRAGIFRIETCESRGAQHWPVT